MQAAMNAVTDDELLKKQASKQFGIPGATTIRGWRIQAMFRWTLVASNERLMLNLKAANWVCHGNAEAVLWPVTCRLTTNSVPVGCCTHAIQWKHNKDRQGLVHFFLKEPLLWVSVAQEQVWYKSRDLTRCIHFVFLTKYLTIIDIKLHKFH